MPPTSFTVDTTFDHTLEELQQHFGLPSKADVLRKAVALLCVVSRNENKDGSITLRRDADDLKIVLR